MEYVHLHKKALNKKIHFLKVFLLKYLVIWEVTFSNMHYYLLLIKTFHFSMKQSLKLSKKYAY